MLNFVKEVLVAILTGIATGWMVTEFYRDSDKRASWLRDFEEEKQIMSGFLNQLYFEIELFRGNENRVRDDIMRVLKAKPRFSSLSSIKNKELFVGNVIELNQWLKELEEYISLTGNQPIKYPKLIDYKSKVLRAHLEILKLKGTEMYGK